MSKVLEERGWARVQLILLVVMAAVSILTLVYIAEGWEGIRKTLIITGAIYLVAFIIVPLLPIRRWK